MDFTKGEVYKVVLDTDLNGNTFTYPMVITGKCLTTDDTYVSLVESNTNQVKAFKKKQLSKSEPYQGTPSVAKSVMPVMKSVWAAAKSVTTTAAEPAATKAEPAAEPATAKATKAEPAATKATKAEPAATKAEPAKPHVPTLTNKELFPLLEKHLKEKTPFSDKVTELLRYKYEREKNCEPKISHGIIPLNGEVKGNCIEYTAEDTVDTISKKIKSEYKSKGYVYLLTDKSFITFARHLPLFVVTLTTKNDTYLLK
jgi:hypothetical protein